MEKYLPPDPIAQKSKLTVDIFKSAMPVVIALRNERMKLVST